MTAPVIDRPRPYVAAPVPQRTPGRAGSLLALLPAAAGLVIGADRLDIRDMWNDELVTWHATRLSAGEFRMLVGNMDLVHAAYYVLIKAVAIVAGDSPTVLRMPSVVAMALTAALITLIGRRLFDTPVGVLAGAAFVLLPAVSRYAQEARSYALVTLAATAATWLFLRAVDRPSRLRWWMYGLALVLVGWLHFVALLVVGAHVTYLWRAVPAEVPRWRWAASAGLASLFVLPLLVFAGRQSGQISWIKNDADAVLNFVESLTGTHLTLIVAAALSLFALAVSGRVLRPAVLMLLVWAVLPPVLGYLTFAWLHLFMARYFLFTVPAWSLLMAFGVCHGVRVLTRHRVPGVWLVGAAVLLPLLAYQGLPAQQKVRSDEADGQPHYLAAVAYVGKHAKPSDGVAFNDGFGGHSDIARKATDYGLRNQQRPRDVFVVSTARERGWLTAKECPDPVPCLGDTKRIWLIETGHVSDSLAGLPAARGKLLRSQFVVSQVERFERVRVVVLDRKPGR